jgi:pimeloyl-ACP methyl ester carboxylesterase
MAPAVEALARRCRCITYSLCGEPESGARLDPTLGLEALTRQLDDVLDRTGVARAVICGVSFGGRIAVRYAATRPHRTMGLALVSVPGPGWRPDARVHRHLRWPRLLAPVFVATSPMRLAPEIVRAFPDWRSRLAFSVRHTVRVLAAPMSSARMADRARLLADAPECAGVVAPTLVVTGEPGLDKVVSVAATCEYVQAIPGARRATIEGTGHIGLVTKAERFAEIVAGFAEECVWRAEGAEPASSARVRSASR